MAKLCLFLAKVYLHFVWNSLQYSPFQMLTISFIEGRAVCQTFGDMDALLETKRSLKGDLQVKRDEAKVAAE